MLAPPLPYAAPGSAACWDDLLTAYQDWVAATFAASARPYCILAALAEGRAMIVMLFIAERCDLKMREPSPIRWIETRLNAYLRATGRAA